MYVFCVGYSIFVVTFERQRAAHGHVNEDDVFVMTVLYHGTVSK
jgi:hypothetical protein